MTMRLFAGAQTPASAPQRSPGGGQQQHFGGLGDECPVVPRGGADRGTPLRQRRVNKAVVAGQQVEVFAVDYLVLVEVAVIPDRPGQSKSRNQLVDIKRIDFPVAVVVTK